MKKYLEQYNRVKRWYDLVKKIDDICIPGSDPVSRILCREDICYAFFINCYHLKDWIENDNSIGVGKDKTDKFLRKSRYLKICHDLCIGSKHLIIKTPKANPRARIIRRGVMKNLSGPDATYAVVYYEVNVNGKICDAFNIATKCIQEWDKFLKDNKLPISDIKELHFDS